MLAKSKILNTTRKLWLLTAVKTKNKENYFAELKYGINKKSGRAAEDQVLDSFQSLEINKYKKKILNTKKNVDLISSIIVTNI